MPNLNLELLRQKTQEIRESKTVLQEYVETGKEESELSLELGEHLHMPVDVRILNGAPLGFQYAVTSGEPVFTRDPAAFFNYRERVWLNYLDYKYFYEQSLKDLLAP
ncbi:nucleotidyltransferase domain-containing protein [Acidobacteria bacterium AH-259-A15]|nr:nucleotidyltransferase domain-containing protein [Acidobacteria bacterium AH-259-A15]